MSTITSTSTQMPKVVVVTPTVGSKHLAKCLQSVQNQTYTNIVHYVFIDGHQYVAPATEILQSLGEVKRAVQATGLAENVGAGGWYGHRIYAACSFLVNADIICYLDEDNWFEPDHVEKMVETLTTKNYDWVYSLRKIYDSAGKYICDDNCESLGKWPAYVNDDVFHIDTSCYAIKREVATAIGHAWYEQWGADRRFFSLIKQYFPNFGGTTAATCCYRLGGNDGSVTKDFFVKGNKKMAKKYPKGFPWKLEN